jgi:hypothetical protein
VAKGSAGRASTCAPRVCYLTAVLTRPVLQDESCGVRLCRDDIRVHNLRIDYTMKNNNPLEHVGFYEVCSWAGIIGPAS